MKKIIDFCEKYNMLPKEGLVLACVSGGADSMCLLGILLDIAPNYGFKVSAVHYNHNLRGEESDGDEAFVSGFCRERGIDCFIGSGDVKTEASRRGIGTEEAARDMRYAFFHEVAEKTGAVRIATAHTADDNAETMLFNLARGSGGKGLSGVPPVRGDIIRPILCLSRADVENYLESRGIPHREDSTNSSDDYSRNMIRHHVIPVLKNINPEFCSASLNAASLLRQDEEYLEAEASEYIENCGGTISASSLLKLPKPLSSRVIRLLCPRALSSGHIDDVLKLASSENPSASLSLPGITLRRRYDEILFDKDAPSTFESTLLPENGVLEIDGIDLRFLCEKTINRQIINKSFTSFRFKYDNICGNIHVRPRISGDKIKLEGSAYTKTLKKLFIEKKIPAHERSCVPVIADELGPIAIPGIGSAERVRPDIGDTVLKVTVEEIKNHE